MDKEKTVISVFFELKRVTELVDTKIPVTKLWIFRIRCRPNKWLRNYLRES